MVAGAIRQAGYVVRDLRQAIDYWVRVMGVGPFFVLPRTTFSSCIYQGRETRPELGVAVANWGDVQIELIQQLNDEPSYYTDFLNIHGEGMQHLAVWSQDYETDRDAWIARGLAPVMEARLSHGIRAVIFDSAPFSGAALEIMECTPAVCERMASIQAAAINWDGNDPVRQMVRSEYPDAAPL